MKKMSWFWSLFFVALVTTLLMGNSAAEAIYSKNLGGDPNYVLCDGHMGTAWYVDASSLDVQMYAPPQYIIAVNVVSVQDADMGNTAIHDVRTMRFFYNYDMQHMYVDRRPSDGDWRYLDPKVCWADIGITHPAGKIAFRLAYGRDFYER